MRRAMGLRIAEQVIERARGEGVGLVDPGGVLNGLPRTVRPCRVHGREGLGIWATTGTIHRAAPWAAHAKAAGPRTVLTPGTGAGRRARGTRDGTFEPETVKRHWRRMPGVAVLVISLFVGEGTDDQ